MDALAKVVEIVREAKKRKRDKPLGVELLAERYANKLDLWTGLPLKTGGSPDATRQDTSGRHT